MATTVAYLSSTAYSATDARRVALGSMAHTTGSGFTARSGVIAAMPTALAIASAGGLFISIQPGQAVVDGQYLVTHDAAVNVTVEAGGASTRWDAIILQVNDSSLGDLTNNAVVRVIKGTTTAIPTNIPARSLLLGTVIVGSGVVSINSGNIVDRRTYTASVGGTVQIPGVVADPSLANGLTSGTTIYDTATDKLMLKTQTGVRRAAPDSFMSTGTPLKGAFPSDMNQLRINAGLVSATTNSFGDLDIPSGFTQCLASVSCQGVDGSTGIMYYYLANAPDATRVWLRPRLASNGAQLGPGSFVLFNYIFVGC